MPEYSLQQKQQSGFTMLELIVVIVVISVLGLFVLDRVWYLRIAAEKASVTQIIGNIRSALGLEVARRALNGSFSAVTKLENSNPIPLLSQPPNNYLGEMENGQTVIESGIWYFDKKDKTLVYNVKFPENFQTTYHQKKIRHQIKLIYYDNNRNKRYDSRIDNIAGLDLQPLEKFSWDVENLAIQENKNE